MTTIIRLAETASLIGDPTRAAMLYALMDGRAFTAGELAEAAGVTPQTASGHLAQLVAAGMLAVEAQGRHRYFRIASAEIGAILEGLQLVTADRIGRLPRPGPRDAALRKARICYDHLAGELGVALFAALAGAGHLRLSADGAALSDSGTALLGSLDIEVPARRRPTCRPCLDWSERRHHLAGQAGAAICTAALARGWVRRRHGSRALDVTPTGTRAFAAGFGVRLP
ncbi:metalloregulator ArsR/SmtB family transcription factor [Sphingomonas sp. MAH-20]|uniref:Metalloregulator ArsR/SmtB family transcription factor n=1 Tax=Sphingomonas horti TaxID=2682842 RepID=A0A6I4IY70_9SPHN|nr:MULTISPECIES: winged helix-turn-helix domain-containing protein [Sphingomonas]MBA2918201.1 winged helix-turn-helix transcriptional regulator [Sphingomonas sp. CGMCC 1.13658]MVO77170.1 metalloregulator ArsR/SmtB family transcription factor [Sphingomonas horti]